MGQSLSKVYLHIVFHTKSNGIKLQPNVLPDLFAYIGGITRQYDSYSIQVGGTTDHIHLLCTLPRTITIAKLVEEIKKSSSKWLKTRSTDYQWFEWQTGYGAFSVSHSQVNTVVNYILTQEEHHKKVSTRNEYLQWLSQYEVECDDRYFLQD